MIRRVLFWAGWVLLVAYTVTFAAQAYLMQDIPPVSVLKWGLLFATCGLIYAARDRDEPIHHHLPH